MVLELDHRARGGAYQQLNWSVYIYTMVQITRIQCIDAGRHEDDRTGPERASHINIYIMARHLDYTSILVHLESPGF